MLARSDAYPDALAGASPAHQLGGPLLSTHGDALDPRVADEIDRLGAEQATILGSADVMSGCRCEATTGPTPFSAVVTAARAGAILALMPPDGAAGSATERWLADQRDHIDIAILVGSTSAITAKGQRAVAQDPGLTRALGRRVPAVASTAGGGEMTASRTVEEPGMGTLEVWDLPTDQDTLDALLRRVFGRYWDRIYFGVLVQGAVLEIRAPRAPHFGMLDGYLTIDFEEWHLHVCIGPTSGPPGNPTDAEAARIRPTARAELYRALRGQGCTPATWGLRLYNGADEQQLTVLLPNPFLTADQEIRTEPDWNQLDVWDDLRATFLGLESDPLDRRGTGLHHG